MMTEDKQQVQVAAYLKRWFELYAKLDGTPPRHKSERMEWQGDQFRVWNGLRNLSRELGEWLERNVPNVDPSAMVELAGTSCPVGQPMPDGLLKRAWVTARRLQAVVGTLGQAVADRVIGETKRSEAVELVADAADRTADSKTDNGKKPFPILPENNDVTRLARDIKRRLPQGERKIDIALDFTEGDAKRADSLLRQLRRFPYLLE